MNCANGFNPLLWECANDGCFNELRRPKIEVFADCFPRKINFGDVDGLVEIGGRFCLLEWKGKGGAVRIGQIRSFAAFTRGKGNVVFVVEGDADTMAVRRYQLYWMGKPHPWRDACLAQLKERMRAWADWAEHPGLQRRVA